MLAVFESVSVTLLIFTNYVANCIANIMQCFAALLLALASSLCKVRKGTGFVSLADLPSDGEEEDWLSLCQNRLDMCNDPVERAVQVLEIPVYQEELAHIQVSCRLQ